MKNVMVNLCVLAVLAVYNVAEAQTENVTPIKVNNDAALDDLMTPDDLEDTMVRDGAIDDEDTPRLWQINSSRPKVRAMISRSTQEILFTAPELQNLREITVPSRYDNPNDPKRPLFGNRTYDLSEHLVRGPDGLIYFRAKVSTGGTLKQPSNLVRAAYCASTPVYNNFIPAAGRMHRDYKSRTFVKDDGEGVAMPWAMHVTGGIFLHETPEAGLPNMGKNVSGGCVRLHQNTAEILYELMRKHGGMHLKISGDNPRSECQVTPEVVAERQRLRRVCAQIGRNDFCYKHQIEEAIAMGRLPADSGPRQIMIAQPPVVRPANGWDTSVTRGDGSASR